MNEFNWPYGIVININRYYVAYMALIARAKSRPVDISSYREKHHIIPRSLGGDDATCNIAVLTAKEHYLAHRFLPRFTTGDHRYKMLYALDAMGMRSRNTVDRWRMPARVYEYNRISLSMMGHRNETKIKIGLANKGRKPHNTGKQRSIETRLKIKQGHLGKKGHPASDKAKEVAKLTHTGRKRSIETREKLRVSKIGANNPMYGKHHSLDIIQQKRKLMRSLVWIHNPILRQRKRVSNDVIESYLSDGWLRGKLSTFTDNI